MRVPKIIVLLVICLFIFDAIEAKINKKHHSNMIKKRADRHHAQKHEEHHHEHGHSQSHSHSHSKSHSRHHSRGVGDGDGDGSEANQSDNSVDTSTVVDPAVDPNADTSSSADQSGVAPNAPTCRYQERDGTCQATCGAANSASDASKIQTACPTGLTCCFTDDTSNWCSRGHQAGTCITPSACTALNTDADPHHTSPGLCHGAANSANKCCLAGADKTAGFDTSTMNTLVPIPTGINANLNSAPIAFQKLAMGNPGVRCSTDACLGCCDSESPVTRSNLVDMDVGPFNLRVFRPFGETIKQVFEDVLAARPELFWYVATAGAFCCRPVKHMGHALVGTYSNHAWGAAVDLYYGPTIDAQGDNKAQQGLVDLVPYFNARNIFWGGGFSTEDSMHFEASKQAVIAWGCSGTYASTGFQATSGSIGGVTCPADDSTAALNEAVTTGDQTVVALADEGEDDDTTGDVGGQTDTTTQLADNTGNADAEEDPNQDPAQTTKIGL